MNEEQKKVCDTQNVFHSKKVTPKVVAGVNTQTLDIQKNTRIWVVIALLTVAVLLTTGYFAFLCPAVPYSPLFGKTIFLAGDSRSSPDYTFYKKTLEMKTGAKVLVEGASGCLTAYNASNEYFVRLEQPHDFSIWLIGGNDNGSKGTIGTFSAESELGKQGESVVTETNINEDYNGWTFIQAVDHIMRKYQKMFHGDRKMIFCTEIPQQRDGPDSEWSKKENWERKRMAIIECCEKNGIECLDLYTLCNFDMSQEPMFHAPTDTKSNNGVYYMDGLHPNPKGIEMITDFEIEKMESLLTE